MRGRCFSNVGERWAPLLVPPGLSGPVLDRLLPMLVGLDEDYIRAHPRTPLLRDSGVRYRRDMPGREKWLSIPAVLEAGAADCKSLAAWRVAELRARGVPAECKWTVTRAGNMKVFHVAVRHAYGDEDPSADLGMGWAELPPVI